MKPGLYYSLLLIACTGLAPMSLRASAGGEAFNTSTGALNVDYAGYMSKQDVVYGSPVTNPIEGLTVGQGKVGMMVWSQNGLTMQISGVDDSEQGAYSEGLINLVTSPGMDTNYTNFLERLSLFNGTLTTTYDTNRTVTIMGAPNSEVMGIHVNDTRTGVTAVTLQLSMWPLSGLTNSGNVPNLGTWQTVSAYANATSAGFSRGQADPNDFGYTLAATVDGTPFTTQVISTGEGVTQTVQLNITPATSYTIWISCASRLNAPGNNSVAQAASELSAVTGTYTATLASYEAWWNAFWGKSFVEFSNSTGYADYIENLYYLATYMIASGGYGNYPFHFINGVFRATEDNTKWSNAYWYWNQRDVYNSFLASNHPDMMNVFNNLYARNASALQTQTNGRYALTGTWVPETMGFNGNDSGTVGSSYTDNIYSSGTEAAENMYRQYTYTNNYAYLTSTAYPFMKQVCTFYSNILGTNGNGQYYIPKVVDTNFEDNAHETYWNVQDAITDLAAIRSIFPDAIAAANLQGVDSTLVAQWQNILNNLVPYPVDPGNAGQYYPCDPTLPAASNDENITSELAWPYGRVGLDTSDLSFGISNWNNRPFPYGNVWSPDAIQAARLGLGNDAFQGMQIMMEIYQNYPNGMTNNTNGVFEYLGVNLSALNESLMQSYDGTIRVFPAPTTDSSMISKFTLAARGDFLVTSESEAGELKYVGINSQAGNPCTVANPWGTAQCDVRQVSDNTVLLTTSAASFTFNTAANTVYVIEPTAKPFSDYSYEQVTASQNETAKTMAGNTLGTFAGAAPPPTDGVYVAQDATLSGTAGLSEDQAATGLYEIVDMSQGSSITFSNVVCGNEMVIQYCTESNPGKLDLYINGTLIEPVTFPDTNSWWTTYAQVTVTGLTIPSGATVKLQYDSGDAGTNINYIQILGCSTPSPTRTVSPTVSATATRTASPSPTATVTPSKTDSYTLTPSRTESPSATLSGTETVTPSASRTPSWTASASYTYSASPSPTDSATRSATASPSITATRSPSYSASPSQTPSASPSKTPDASPSVTVTLSATLSSSITATRSPSYSASPSQTPSASPSNTPDASPSVTATLSATLSSSMTVTRSPSYSASPSQTPSASPSKTPDASPSVTATLSATLSSSITVTRSPSYSASPSQTPSASPSKTPDASPSVMATLSATESPSATASLSPSRTMNPSPTDSVTATEASTATPSPTSEASATPTPTLTFRAEPTATPSLDATLTLGAGGSILKTVAWPDPNPYQVSVELSGTAVLTLSVYTKDFLKVAEVVTPPEGPGWVRISIPAGALQELSNGTYYYRVTAGNSRSGATGRFVLIK